MSGTNDRTRQELREDLIDSAVDLLEKEGLDGFSLKRAAKDSDVSKQMIYTLFGGKADLIKAVYDRMVDGLVEELEAFEDSDPIDRLHQYAVAYRNFVLRNEALFDMLYSLSLTKEFEQRRGKVVTRNKIFDYYDEGLRDAVEQGYLDEDVDVERLTDSLWAAANGCIRLEIVDYYDDEKEAEYHYLKTLNDLMWGTRVDGPDPEAE